MYRTGRRITAVSAIAIALLFSFLPGAAAAKKLNVVTATTDFASLAQEVGGDHINVESIAKGYQDPHFVEAKPSFLLKLRQADLLITVGLQLEIGWLPPLITQSADSSWWVRLSRRLAVCRDPGDPDRRGNPRHGRRASVGKPALLA
jgi:ABC-type Zn uptake system ZnuABC Zn-binding protein ZnuA